MPLEEPSFRYGILAKIASGGTATVYVGARAGDATLVALKRPHPHVLEDERQRAALLREAALAASFRHPHIVGVRLVEEAGANLQLVMDYVEGSALGTLVALAAKSDDRIPIAVAVRIVLDASAGLHAVHEHRVEGRDLGLLHRDVSPQNILVGIDGVARLTDFGIAKAIYDGASSTTQGTLKGKLGYMAPEYVHRGQLDRAIDVFAMGVVLWEALAGRRLFRGDNEAQTLDRVLRAEVPPLAGVAKELAVFDRVVGRALAKDPAERFPSAEAFASALEAAAGGSNMLATHAGVADYVARVASPELSRRRDEIRAARGQRGRFVRLAGWAALAATVAAASIVLGLRSSPAPSAAPLSASASPAPPSSSSSVTPSDPASPSASAASEDPEIELDPSPSSSASPRRPRPTPPRQPPPNPYVHRGSR